MTRFAVVVVAAALGPLAGCSLGQGEGVVRSESLYAADCWLHNSYDLQPDFFAAVPYRQTLQIRVQRGSDLQEVSDGFAVQVDDVDLIRSQLGKPVCLSLPAGVVAPGSLPIRPDPLVDAVCGGQYPVHAALYLQSSCHNQNTVLYAISGTIVFDALFSGDPNEDQGAEKYTSARFEEVVIGDPHDAPPSASADQIPDDKRSKLTGNFSFYFERGQPGQPFP